MRATFIIVSTEQGRFDTARVDSGFYTAESLAREACDYYQRNDPARSYRVATFLSESDRRKYNTRIGELAALYGFGDNTVAVPITARSATCDSKPPTLEEDRFFEFIKRKFIGDSRPRE
jgi:hypothetical protein